MIPNVASVSHVTLKVILNLFTLSISKGNFINFLSCIFKQTTEVKPFLTSYPKVLVISSYFILFQLWIAPKGTSDQFLYSNFSHIWSQPYLTSALLAKQVQYKEQGQDWRPLRSEDQPRLLVVRQNSFLFQDVHSFNAAILFDNFYQRFVIQLVYSSFRDISC